MPQALHRFPVAPAHRGEEIHRRQGAELEELLQVPAIEPQGLGILRRNHRRAARAVIEHGKFAEKIPAGGHFEHDALARVVLEIHLHLTRANHVDGVAGLSVVEDGLARLEGDHVELRGQFRPRVVIQQLEQGDLFEQVGFRTHAERMTISRNVSNPKQPCG